MKICAYVQESFAKPTYRNECLDSRQFVGLRVVIDALSRAGYAVDWAGSATVHRYDLVLVSITSDCDWWSFIIERLRWQPGNYKVIIGGAGVLHVSPFLPSGDFFSLGRGEWSIVNLVRRLDGKDGEQDSSIIEASSFSPDRQYQVRQTSQPYPYALPLSKTRRFQEGPIGCNHKCLFCGYTWQRKFISQLDYYAMSDSLFGGIEAKERAMLDMAKDFSQVDFRHLRTTALDGMSERLRVAVGKPITRQMVVDFLSAMIHSDEKPHQIKLYNIVGYPGETLEDWKEFLDTLRQADKMAPQKERQWSIVLHSTPFRAMPATPMACAPMSKVNYRGKIGRTLGPALKGNLIYQGKNLWSVESMGTESLASVMLSAIAHRGDLKDWENIKRLCWTGRFWRASAQQKEATLEKYFDMDYLFGPFTSTTLPSRYLRTYCQVEKTWDERLWERRSMNGGKPVASGSPGGTWKETSQQKRTR